MWQADNLVFLQLQKCASTRIAEILTDNVGGHVVGKHEPFRGDPAGKRFLGSVRNPWSWYVSLWAFGCSGKGRVYNQVAVTNSSSAALKFAWSFRRELHYNPLAGIAALRSSRANDVAAWQDMYADADDPE